MRSGVDLAGDGLGVERVTDARWLMRSKNPEIDGGSGAAGSVSIVDGSTGDWS